ncbi:MAG: DUF2752 domain-containing protein [Blautia sp.]
MCVPFWGLPDCPALPALTRAGLLFLHGDFAGAFRMHPFFYGLLALAVGGDRPVFLGEIHWMD